jgi:hypothetical protein
MAHPAHIAAHDDDEDSTLIAAINYIPNRRLVVAAGRLARAEQQQLQLRDGRQGRGLKRTPRGYFSGTKGRGRPLEATPRVNTPDFPDFFLVHSGYVTASLSQAGVASSAEA